MSLYTQAKLNNLTNTRQKSQVWPTLAGLSCTQNSSSLEA